jgi:hypothetical protein
MDMPRIRLRRDDRICRMRWLLVSIAAISLSSTFAQLYDIAINGGHASE